MTSNPMYNYKDVAAGSVLEQKVKKVTDKHSETLNIIANEPSLAFYRIQEHIRKTLPLLVDQKHGIEDMQALVQGACFDAEYASNAVKVMNSSSVHFQNIQELLKNAMFMKQQINYLDSRRKQNRPNLSTIPGPGDVGRTTEAGAVSSRDGTTSENGHAMDSSADTSDCLHNEPVMCPKKSLQASHEGQEVDVLMPRPQSLS